MIQWLLRNLVGLAALATILGFGITVVVIVSGVSERIGELKEGQESIKKDIDKDVKPPLKELDRTMFKEGKGGLVGEMGIIVDRLNRASDRLDKAEKKLEKIAEKQNQIIGQLSQRISVVEKAYGEMSEVTQILINNQIVSANRLSNEIETLAAQIEALELSGEVKVSPQLEEFIIIEEKDEQ